VSIEYTVHGEHPEYMHHVDRQRAYESTCYGCQEAFTTAWPHGALLAVITDRSGSEQASTHNRQECIDRAVAKLYEDDYYD
jgi:hypothetical protein